MNFLQVLKINLTLFQDLSLLLFFIYLFIYFCFSSSDGQAEYKRRRHHSGVSAGDFDDLNEDMVFLEPRSAVEIFDGNFSWNLETKELALKNISVKIPMGELC